MKKLKLQMQVSIDGYVAGPEGAAFFKWDDEVRNYCITNARQIDYIVLGRKTAKDFIPHWKGVAANRKDADFEVGTILTDTPKIVFSKTLKESKWENTTVIGGEIVEQITILKKKAKQDLLVYGGAGFAASLIEHNLVDEYYLLVNPIALGNGTAIFGSLKRSLPLTLVKSRHFKCGTVLLGYESRRD